MSDERKRIYELESAQTVSSNDSMVIDNPNREEAVKIPVNSFKTMLTKAEYDALPSSKNTDDIIYYITDSNKIMLNGNSYGGGGVVELTQAQYDALPSSKLTDGILYCITDATASASDVPYDNTESGLEAEEVQSAIDELQDTKANSDNLAPVATSGSYNDLDDKPTFNAEAISYDNTSSGLEADNVQDAIDEVLSTLKIVRDIPNTPTAIATFSDGSDLPMSKLEVGIEPIQEGSGDPSPTNVRPISGWDEVNVGVAGKNLWNNNWSAYTQPSDYRICPIKLENGQYTASVKLKEGGTRQSGFTLGIAKQGDRYTNFGSFYTASTGADKTGTITVDDAWTAPKLIVYCSNESAFNAIFENYEIQLEEGSTATTYEPYNGTTYTIDLDGTRYGGKVDVVSGVMTVDRVMKEVTIISSMGQTSGGLWFCTSSISNAPSIDGSEIISDYFKLGYGTVGCCYITGGGTILVFILPQDITTPADATSWCETNKPHFVYYLATPLTIQLTPTVVKSLRGMNNVYADSGDVRDGKYIADASSTIASLDARITALENQ